MKRYVVKVPTGAAGAERRYLAALQRIIDGVPEDPRAKALLEAGRLEISQQCVVIEAGRTSRTPICGPQARWPRVRDAIADARRALRPTPTPAAPDAGDAIVPSPGMTARALHARLGRLRGRFASERAKRQVACTTAAACILLLREAGIELATLRQRPADRNAARRAAESRLPTFSAATPEAEDQGKSAPEA